MLTRFIAEDFSGTKNVSAKHVYQKFLMWLVLQIFLSAYIYKSRYKSEVYL